MARLENWCLVKSEHDLEEGLKNSLTAMSHLPYMASEIFQLFQLKGTVFDHPKKRDGQTVRTSVCVHLDCNKRVAATKSGTLYELGTPDPDWIEWLKKNNFTKYLKELST